MANITFSGNVSGNYLYIGGIAGYVSWYKNETTLENCANYGHITQYGNSLISFIGGITGYYYVKSYVIAIQNALNYGNITINEMLNKYSYTGGIVGYNYANFENCVNAGNIISSQDSSNIGNIAGYTVTTRPVNITNCFWTNVNYNVSGTGNVSINEESSLVEPSSDTVSKLNSFSAKYSWNGWLFNENKASISFKTNYGKGFTVYSQIILLPDPAYNGIREFSGWYNDEELTSSFEGSEVHSDTTLYGVFCGSADYVVTLDVNGGEALTVNTITVKCNGTYGELEKATKPGETFAGWFTAATGGRKVETGDRVVNLNDHTLYAHWICVKYTVTFIFDNGTDPEVRIFGLDESIDFPTISEKEGYTFKGWNSSAVTMPAENLTLAVQWIQNQYNVTLNVNGGDDLVENIVVATFDANYNLTTPTRAGYTFLGWFTEGNEKITNEDIVKIAKNHTLTAQWSEIPVIHVSSSSSSSSTSSYSSITKNELSSSKTVVPTSQMGTPTDQVEIVLGKSGMTQKEIEDYLKQHTNANFTVMDFEETETGETRVIIKFTDVEKAEEFADSMNELSGSERSFVRNIRFNSNNYRKSFSGMPYPLVPLFNFMV